MVQDKGQAKGPATRSGESDTPLKEARHDPGTTPNQDGTFVQ